MARFVEIGVIRKSSERRGCGALAGAWFASSACLPASPGSQGTLRSGRYQLRSDLVEVGQGKHGLGSSHVFGEPSVAGLHEAPELLDLSARASTSPDTRAARA